MGKVSSADKMYIQMLHGPLYGAKATVAAYPLNNPVQWRRPVSVLIRQARRLNARLAEVDWNPHTWIQTLCLLRN